MSQSTYYTCNGCDHATFRLSEAIQHFAEMGPRHATTNAPLRFDAQEWALTFDPYKYEPLFFEDDGVDDQIVRWS